MNKGITVACTLAESGKLKLSAHGRPSCDMTLIEFLLACSGVCGVHGEGIMIVFKFLN